MSPIRNPSSLTFLGSKTEMDAQTRHIPHQLHKPGSHGEQGTDFKLPLPISDKRRILSNQVEYSNTILPLPTNRDANESQLSESLLPFCNAREHLLSSKQHQKHIRHHSPPQVVLLTVWLSFISVIVAGGFKT